MMLCNVDSAHASESLRGNAHSGKSSYMSDSAFDDVMNNEGVVLLNRPYRVSSENIHRPYTPKFSSLIGLGENSVIEVEVTNQGSTRIFRSLYNVTLKNVYFKIVFKDSSVDIRTSLIETIKSCTLYNVHVIIASRTNFFLGNDNSGILTTIIKNSKLTHVGVIFNSISIGSIVDCGLISGASENNEELGVFVKGSMLEIDSITYYGILYGKFSSRISYSFVDIKTIVINKLSVSSVVQYIGLMLGRIENSNKATINNCFALVRESIKIDTKSLYLGLIGETINSDIRLKESWINIKLDSITSDNYVRFGGLISQITKTTIDISRCQVFLTLLNTFPSKSERNVYLNVISYNVKESTLKIKDSYIFLLKQFSDSLVNDICDVNSVEKSNINVTNSYYSTSGYSVSLSSKFGVKKENIVSIVSFLKDYEMSNDVIFIYNKNMPYYNKIILYDDKNIFKNQTMEITENGVTFIQPIFILLNEDVEIIDITSTLEIDINLLSDVYELNPKFKTLKSSNGNGIIQLNFVINENCKDLKRNLFNILNEVEIRNIKFEIKIDDARMNKNEMISIFSNQIIGSLKNSITEDVSFIINTPKSINLSHNKLIGSITNTTLNNVVFEYKKYENTNVNINGLIGSTSNSVLQNIKFSFDRINEVKFNENGLFESISKSHIYNIHIYAPEKMKINSPNNVFGILSKEINSSSLIHVGIYIENLDLSINALSFGFISGEINNSGEYKLIGLFLYGKKINITIEESITSGLLIGRNNNNLKLVNSFTDLEELSVNSYKDYLMITFGNLIGYSLNALELIKCFVITRKLTFLNTNDNNKIIVSSMVGETEGNKLILKECWSYLKTESIRPSDSSHLYYGNYVGKLKTQYIEIEDSYNNLEFEKEITKNNIFGYLFGISNTSVVSSIKISNSYFKVDNYKFVNLYDVFLDNTNVNKKVTTSNSYIASIEESDLCSSLMIDRVSFKNLIQHYNDLLAGYSLSNSNSLYINSMPYTNGYDIYDPKNTLSACNVVYKNNKPTHVFIPVLVSTTIPSYPTEDDINSFNISFIKGQYYYSKNSFIVEIESDNECVKFYPSNEIILSPLSNVIQVNMSNCSIIDDDYKYEITYTVKELNKIILQSTINIEIKTRKRELLTPSVYPNIKCNDVNVVDDPSKGSNEGGLSTAIIIVISVASTILSLLFCCCCGCLIYRYYDCNEEIFTLPGW